MTDNEVIAAAIEVLRREVIGEGCTAWDYDDWDTDEDFDPAYGRDINSSGRCYCCAATQVVEWLKNYLAADEPKPKKVPS
jgi:hypothetical protein